MRRVLRAIGAILLCAAFVFLLGTAGSSDLNAIPFGQIIAQCAICLIAGGIGFGIMYVTEGGN